MTALADSPAATARPRLPTADLATRAWPGRGPPVRSVAADRPGRSGTRRGPSGPGRCCCWPSPPPPRCGPAGSASRRRPGSGWSPCCRASGPRSTWTRPSPSRSASRRTRPTRCAPGWRPSHWISPRTRRFAKWSAICSFLLGMAGQVAYHLLVQAASPGAVGHHHRRVLPAGPGPGHGDRAGPHAARRRHRPRTPRTAGPQDQSSERSPDWSAGDQPADQPDQDRRDQDHGPDQSPREDQRASALPAGRTTQPRQAPGSRSPAPAERACAPHRPRASRRRETGVAAGTAQRRSQGVQREPERARPPAQRRTSERADNRPIESGAGQRRNCCPAHQLARTGPHMDEKAGRSAGSPFRRR